MSLPSLLRVFALCALTLVSCTSAKNTTQTSSSTPSSASVSSPAPSVSAPYTVTPAVSHQGVVVQGVLTWNEWKQVAQWSNYASDAMIPPPVLGITKGRLSTGAYSFVVLGGTWCGDSKRGMPHIFSLLQKLDVPDKNIVLIGVNEAKQEPKELCTKYAVAFVPTLIVYRDGVEIGRIVEHPQQSWHDDLAAIVLK